MKKFIAYAAIVALLGLSTGVVAQQTFLNANVWTSVIYYTDSISSYITAPFPGMFMVEHSDTASPVPYIYDAFEGENDQLIVADENQTLSGSNTFSGAVATTSTVAIGADEDDGELTVNVPATFNVKRIDFEFNGFYAEPAAGDDLVLDVADTNANYLHFPGAQITPLYIRYEQAFGGTFAPETVMALGTTAANGNVLLIDNAALLDVADNDGIEFALFGDPDDVALWNESTGKDAYCEMQLRIDDISDISANDFYFGWFLNAAINDAFAYEGANTWAGFGVLDTAGDLVIQAELNGGGHGEDDSGTTLADDGTYTLRVEMSADAVAFYVDGTAVTATNAVLDADDGDTFSCRFGIRSAGTSAATIEVNYIEIGLEQ